MTGTLVQNSDAVHMLMVQHVGERGSVHLVKTDLSPLRLTSVYSADAMVASGVRP